MVTTVRTATTVTTVTNGDKNNNGNNSDNSDKGNNSDNGDNSDNSDTSTKLAALYSATKSLQNSRTAKLQLFSSILEAKQQLYSSCSGIQKRWAAFKKCLKVSAAVLQRSCGLSNAAK